MQIRSKISKFENEPHSDEEEGKKSAISEYSQESSSQGNSNGQENRRFGTSNNN